MILDFTNKNMYRRYPIRGDVSCTTALGEELPTQLIAGLQLTVPSTINTVFVYKVYAKGTYVSVSIADYATGLELGSFSGFVVSNFTSLKFLPRAGIVASGKLVIGEIPATLQPETVLVFDKEATIIEDSCLLLLTPPAVTKIIDKFGNFCLGNVTTVLDNLTITTGSNTFTLVVVDKELTLSNNDFSGVYRNCKLPVITKINSVTPSPTGNIDIYGIVPLEITVDAPTAKVSLVTDLEIPDVCPDLNKISPPTNASTVYYTDILTTETPEWKGWPQYT